MLRRVRLTLAGALVALSSLFGVVVAAPAAQASESTGWQQINVHVSGDVLGDITGSASFDCTHSFRIVTQASGSATMESSVNGRCIGGPDLSPGFCSSGEVGCTEAYWDINGAGCEGPPGSIVTLHPPISSNAADNTAHKAFTLGATTVGATGCDPEEACLYIATSGHMGEDGAPVGCAPLALDPPVVEPTGSTCAYGNAVQGFSEANLDVFRHHTTWWWYGLAHAYVAKSTLSSGTWITYVVFDSKATSSGPVDSGDGYITEPDTSYITAFGLLGSVSGTGNTDIDSRNLAVNSSDQDQVDVALGELKNRGTTKPDASTMTPWRDVVGVGVFREQSWGSRALNNNTGSSGWWRHPTSNNMDVSQGVVGVNYPTRCAFYWGAKLWNNSTLTADEPGGTLLTEDTPPTDDPPTDPGDVDEPSDDLGWWALIVSWLKNIWSAISGLAGRIASAVASAISGVAQAILDGIAGLFVPDDPDFYDDAFQDVKQEWRDSAPGAFLLGFSEMGVSWPSSGCGGIPVAFAAQGVSVDFNLGEACSGAAASAAATVKVVVSASLVLFGGIASVRAIGSGFGWSPGVGRGEGA